jgi:hypothetical protein
MLGSSQARPGVTGSYGSRVLLIPVWARDEQDKNIGFIIHILTGIILGGMVLIGISD